MRWRYGCRSTDGASSSLESGHSALEASVVVEGDLRHDVVRPVILVEVIGCAGSPHKTTVQLVRVVLAGVAERPPGTLGRGRVTGRSLGALVTHTYNVHLVMRVLWKLVSIANEVAEAIRVVPQHVVDLAGSVLSELSGLDTSVGSLDNRTSYGSWHGLVLPYPKADEGKVGCVSV